ncbi:TetR/AcrR family transcriptional regulator [Pseudonocardia lacus]|uniref:TetR/AcrR family transcriptional regulator n=1 Tax=Pseudonocardia lacus TaxID=2835865 RepID=UPI001BDD8BE9|nr:TetR/AcrR family transcriptional regulator [Pseudonocardia lacus]
MVTRTPRRSQAERREQTGSALLRAAAELVVEGGVQALTLARVGERAGYSRGIVTHHFGSKKALVDALARASQAGFVPDAPDEPGLDRLLHLVDGYIGALGGTRTMSRAFLLLWAEATTSADLAETFRERDERFRADLRADVAAGIAAGTVRADVDPHDVAVAVLGQLRGIGLQHQLDPAAVPTERLRRVVADQWRRALVPSDPAAGG